MPKRLHRPSCWTTRYSADFHPRSISMLGPSISDDSTLPICPSITTATLIRISVTRRDERLWSCIRNMNVSIPYKAVIGNSCRLQLRCVELIYRMPNHGAYRIDGDGADSQRNCTTHTTNLRTSTLPSNLQQRWSNS